MEPDFEFVIDKLRKKYRGICDIFELLSDYKDKTAFTSEDAKKVFQFDCTHLLSSLGYEDGSLSSREKEFIKLLMRIDISDSSAAAFSMQGSKFSMDAVSETVKYIAAVDSNLWKRLGTSAEDYAMTVIDFFESMGEAFLKVDNPSAQLSSLYHFIAVQKAFIKGTENIQPVRKSGNFFSGIGSDFFGSPLPGSKSDKGSGSAPVQTSSGESVKPENYTVKQEEMEDPMGELQSLIGLTDIKKDVEELINLVKMQKIRSERGMKSIPVSLHLVFTGNPGTGKSTVARILAQLYKQIGVVETGQLIETDRSGLVAGYVGQTAIKTQEMIKQAMGGILFIDEAYALAKEGNDFGQEAIETLLKAMEDNRDKFIVIVAGYDDLMENFINSNPGLKSRFNKYFHFNDYNAQELLGIFKMNCNKYQYKLDEEAEKAAAEYLTELEANKDANFANGRDVRNYFEKVVTKQASRISKLESPSDDEVLTLTAEDMKLQPQEDGSQVQAQTEDSQPQDTQNQSQPEESSAPQVD